MTSFIHEQFIASNGYILLKFNHFFIDPIKLIFNVLGNEDVIDNDWRPASVNDAENSMENVKDALRYRKWLICKLADGSITGYGHGYEINRDNKQKVVDKLIVNDGKSIFLVLFHLKFSLGYLIRKL